MTPEFFHMIVVGGCLLGLIACCIRIGVIIGRARSRR